MVQTWQQPQTYIHGVRRRRTRELVELILAGPLIQSLCFETTAVSRWCVSNAHGLHHWMDPDVSISRLTGLTAHTSFDFSNVPDVAPPKTLELQGKIFVSSVVLIFSGVALAIMATVKQLLCCVSSSRSVLSCTVTTSFYLSDSGLSLLQRATRVSHAALYVIVAAWYSC